MPYSSDLTDAEWAIFEPLLLEILPTKKQILRSQMASITLNSEDDN
jgi:transposase